MGHYEFRKLEPKWQDYWEENRTFVAEKLSDKPKYYALDMFPYPSGSGLHVGHPLGYIATDIVARYRRLKGYNVMHPMGFDAFGLPAEQYAIETGQHPAKTTTDNIKRFKEQLKVIGLAYDPEAELRTCDPDYYKWTQWIFMELFNSWYDKDADKARPLTDLIFAFEANGNAGLNAATDFEGEFSAGDWNALTDHQKEERLLQYRLAYTTMSTVNWCPALGTVLANDEVINGVSERGGHPVERKPMRQWVMRMTAYADRLLSGLDTIDWPEPIKEMQRNWIGRSEGASAMFTVEGSNEKIEIFTTRPDTMFGATFMVLAPEHELIESLVNDETRDGVMEYVQWAKNRSELERMQEVNTVTGVFTGAYAINPFTQTRIPIWTSDYVLAGYGTGAIMAVPAHDSRDYKFARHFDIPVIEVVAGGDIEEEAYEAKDGKLVNSGFLDGLNVKQAIKKAIEKIVEEGIGEARVNYRLRDPNFSRQRYWGEPYPIVYKDGLPYGIPESELPLELPNVDSYKPTGDGESPLAALTDWVNVGQGMTRETHTMPGYAGSSWYWFRYLDANNAGEFCDPEKLKYWGQVDLYIGGSEHAVGHLLYSRFWTKFLFDRGWVTVDEPFKKLVNQGMIQGRSSLMYRVNGEHTFVSAGLKDQYETTPIHVDVSFVDNDELDIEKVKKWREEFSDAEYILEDGVFKTGSQTEKMSKRYHNVVNPDDVCAEYGADTLRMYEMFLGPLEVAKPWNTNGIEGVFKFLRKVWNMFTDEENNLDVSDDAPSPDELKVLHQTIKKAEEDIEKLAFNTSVSQFMIFGNEMTRMKCRKRAILEPFLVTLAPFAPHIAEELWQLLGHSTSITHAEWPAWKEEYLTEKAFDYPIQINGKVKMKIKISLDLNKEEIEREVLDNEQVKQALSGKDIRKVIVVPGRIVNVVV